MIRRLLAFFGFALVSRSDAELLAGIKTCHASMVYRVSLNEQDAAYIVVGVREPTDQEFLAALGLKEGPP